MLIKAAKHGGFSLGPAALAPMNWLEAVRNEGTKRQANVGFDISSAKGIGIKVRCVCAMYIHNRREGACRIANTIL